jgi:hypothetical protein
MTATNKQTDRDTVMMSSPLKWPRWPYLPIKKWVNYTWETALLWAGDWKSDTELRAKVGVYRAYLFALPSTLEEFKATRKEEYNSIAELQADGWIVD